MRAKIIGVVTVFLCLATAYSQNSLKRQDAKDDRPADREAIRTVVGKLLTAMEKSSADDVAALLTDGAELHTEDSPSLEGKKAIIDALKKRFAGQDKRQLKLEPESLRFTSKDTATEEGIVKSSTRNRAWSSQRYSLLHVREDGAWKIATIREWSSDDAPLRDLEWLIGEWQAQRDDLAVSAKYEWIGNKAFIRGNITTRQKDRTISAMQVIGLDTRNNAVRIWIFEANGIFAEGTCKRSEDTWAFETNGESPQGLSVASKNILHHVNADTMTWQPVQLRLGDEQIADLPPLKVTRVKK